MNKIRAWIYCCIDAPEDTHGALKSQHEKLDNYCKQMGFEAVGSSHDLAGRQNTTRLGLDEIIVAAKSGKIDVLLVESIGRINRDDMKIIDFVCELASYGITTYSPQEGKINLKKR